MSAVVLNPPGKTGTVAAGVEDDDDLDGVRSSTYAASVEETRQISRAPSIGSTEDVVDFGDMPPVEADPERLGRYRIVKQLGKGAMGTVYEALDPRSTTPVAIKSVSRLSPESLTRFKSEFRLLAVLRHPRCSPFAPALTASPPPACPTPTSTCTRAQPATSRWSAGGS